MNAKKSPMTKLPYLSKWMLIWTGLGIIFSSYALYLETKLEKEADYVASCDINRIVSCTKVLESEYATGFGLVAPIFGEDSALNQKNALYALLTYFMLAILSRFSSPSIVRLNLYVVYGVMGGTAYLFLVQLHLRAICLVCSCMYVVNGAIFVNARRRVDAVDKLSRLEEKND